MVGSRHGSPLLAVVAVLNRFSTAFVRWSQLSRLVKRIIHSLDKAESFFGGSS
jgi:hypothetical protein